MDNRLKIVLIIAALGLLMGLYPATVNAQGPTVVSGILSSDTTWVSANSPYIVTGNILVPESITLSIEPGVEVRFQGKHKIQVEGALVAIGTPEERIIFTSNSEEPKPGDWLGITFTQTSIGSIVDANGQYLSGNTIQFADVSYGGVIIGSSKSIYIANNKFISNLPIGNPSCVLTFEGAPDVRIIRNQILGNAGCGILLGNNTLAIVDRNIIYGNQAQPGDWAAGLGPVDSVSLTNNIIANNYGESATGGLAISGGNPQITKNTFAYNIAGMEWNIRSGGSTFSTRSSYGHFYHNTVVGNQAITTFDFHRISADTIITGNNSLNNFGTYDLAISDYAIYDNPQPPLIVTDNYWGLGVSLNDILAKTYNYQNEFGQPHILINPILPTPVLEAPVIPPSGITYMDGDAQIQLSWSANLEPNISGYKVYYDSDSGYPYAHSLDVGNALEVILEGLAAEPHYIVVTAYNNLADGLDDWTDGHESWFSKEILVDLTPPLLSVESQAHAATENLGSFPLTVKLSKSYGSIVTVGYATSDGTAGAGSDYIAISGTLTFAPGETSKNILIPLIDDTRREVDDTFTVSLSNPTNAALAIPITTTITILDNDPLPTAQFNPDEYWVDETAGTASITVTLSAESDFESSIDYATSDGTAESGSDYIAAIGTLTFAPGETSKNILIPMIDDLLHEDNESFTVNLSNPNNVQLPDTNAYSATVTILDNEPPPIVQFNAATYAVNESWSVVSLEVLLNTASEIEVSVAYTTVNETAEAGSDYISTSGVLTFTPGETSKNILIPIIDNTVQGAAKTFAVTLSMPSEILLGAPSTTVVTILDDDPLPILIEAPVDPLDPVEVTLSVGAGDVQITLDDVQVGGLLTVTLSPGAPASPPANFNLLGFYYEIYAPHVDFGSATIRLPYRDEDVAAAGISEDSLRLLHLEDGVWQDITTELDTDANIISGVTESFSPFVLGVQEMASCATSINSGARFTNSLDIQLFSNIVNAHQMALSDDAGFTGAEWQTYRSAQAWSMADPGERIATLLVYTRARDVNGEALCTDVALSDDIIYDPLPPTLIVSVVESVASSGIQQQFSEASVIGLIIAAADQPNGSGVADMQVSTRPDFVGARWRQYEPSIEIEADPGQTIYVRVRDGVHNISDTASIMIPGDVQADYSIYLPFVER